MTALCVLAMTTQSICAQIGEYRTDFAVGFNGGYVSSNVGFTPEVPQQQHMGATMGFSMRYTCEKYFSSICAVTAELNWTQVGWKEDILTPKDEPVINTYTGLPESYERTMTYLQVPIFARLGWGRERKGLQVFFQAGPQVGFFLGEKTTKSFDIDKMNLTDRTSKIVAQDTMSVERKIDYGIAAGLGIEFSYPHVGHFMLEGRYYYGLGDFYGNSKKDYFGRSNLMNIVVKLTYLFDVVKTNNPKIK